MKLILVLVFAYWNSDLLAQDNLKVRIAEINIHQAFAKAYMDILKEEARTSLQMEEGVISIFPMYANSDSTLIRILEIYADEAAYQSHLLTSHFLKYKTSTLKMVKSLKLVDMSVIDTATLPLIFKKLNRTEH